MDFRNVIIMTDLDGTLLDDRKQIAEKDLSAIDEFRSGGGVFTVATGRGYAMARSVIEKLKINVPCVIFNGAAVYDFQKNEFLWHSDMPGCTADYIRMLQEAFPDIGIEILRKKDVYVVSNNKTVEAHLALENLKGIFAPLDDVPKNDWLKVLIAYPPEKIGKIIEFAQQNCKSSVNWVHSSPMYYEMLPEGISKGSGYKKLLSITGFDKLYTVAAGDYGNDRDMIKAADLGVAVENALDYVKEAAKLIVCDNNHAPMSEIIEYIRKL